MRFQNTLRGYAIVIEEEEVALRFDRFLRDAFEVSSSWSLRFEISEEELENTHIDYCDFSGMQSSVHIVQVYEKSKYLGELALTWDLICNFTNGDWSGAEFHVDEIYGESAPC